MIGIAIVLIVLIVVIAVLSIRFQKLGDYPTWEGGCF